MKKKRKLIAGAAAVLVLTAAFCTWQNNGLTVSRSVLGRSDVPEGFAGYTIVQISDLHNKEFGDGQRRILSKIAEEEPDLIVITGDMIDSRRTDVDTALDFARQAAELASCYYVSGNHESRVPDAYEQLKEGLVDCGVTVLENEKVTIEKDRDSITLAGLKDPDFHIGCTSGSDAMTWKDHLNVLVHHGEGFTILLSHRPEFFSMYVESGADLVFTGHAHGGQWRLPVMGGLVAPGQGFFPEYTEGAYTSGSTTMYVSRGLGNSLMPVRIFNRPELVVVEL